MDQPVLEQSRQRSGRFRPAPIDEARLLASIGEFEIELVRRGDPTSEWALAAKALLDRASIEAADGRIGSAWSSINAGRREVIDSFDATELEVMRTRLRAEALGKVANWRLGAIEALLKPPFRRMAAPASRVVDEHHVADRRRVKEARQLLDEHLDNNYFKIDILRSEAVGAGAVLGVVLVLTVIALAWRLVAVGNAEFLAYPGDALVIMILGALGASVSGVLKPLSADRAMRIPDLLAQAGLAKVRPLVGAGAALIVVTILRSGIGGVQVEADVVPAAAMLSGISERILGQSVATASSAIGK